MKCFQQSPVSILICSSSKVLMHTLFVLGCLNAPGTITKCRTELKLLHCFHDAEWINEDDQLINTGKQDQLPD